MFKEKISLNSTLIQQESKTIFGIIRFPNQIKPHPLLGRASEPLIQLPEIRVFGLQETSPTREFMSQFLPSSLMLWGKKKPHTFTVTYFTCLLKKSCLQVLLFSACQPIASRSFLRERGELARLPNILRKSAGDLHRRVL